MRIHTNAVVVKYTQGSLGPKPLAAYPPERRAAGAVAHAGLCPTHVSVSFSPAVHQDRGHVCEDVRCAALDGKIN